MSDKTNESLLSALSFLPFIIFIAIYLGAGLYFQAQGEEMAFYKFPAVTAMFMALIFAFIPGREPTMVKFDVFARGAGNSNVMAMLMIYLMAGAFSAVAAAMGGRDATVGLGLSLVDPQFLACGIFIISAFMGTATGTSVGTVAAVIPIAASMAVRAGISEALMVGACVGGAMFGDNLSMISDTTIAATRTQGCEMKDKFRTNFFIALPAAIFTCVILLMAPMPETAVDLVGIPSFSLIRVMPYIVVLFMALAGVEVFVVLACGIFLAGAIGLMEGSLTVISFAGLIWDGFLSMSEPFFLALFCGGVSEMIAWRGGIDWLIGRLDVLIRGKRSASLAIAAMVSLVDCATANNTVAIIITGGVAKKISAACGILPRFSASLLDVFSCVFQGLLPYGAQLLTAAALASKNGHPLNSFEIVTDVWYCWALAICGLASIFVSHKSA